MSYDPLTAVAEEHDMPPEFLRDELAARGVDPDDFSVRLANGRASVDDLKRVLSQW